MGDICGPLLLGAILSIPLAYYLIKLMNRWVFTPMGRRALAKSGSFELQYPFPVAFAALVLTLEEKGFRLNELGYSERRIVAVTPNRFLGKYPRNMILVLDLESSEEGITVKLTTPTPDKLSSDLGWVLTLEVLSGFMLEELTSMGPLPEDWRQIKELLKALREAKKQEIAREEATRPERAKKIMRKAQELDAMVFRVLEKAGRDVIFRKVEKGVFHVYGGRHVGEITFFAEVIGNIGEWWLCWYTRRKTPAKVTDLYEPGFFEASAGKMLREGFGKDYGLSRWYETKESWQDQHAYDVRLKYDPQRPSGSPFYFEISGKEKLTTQTCSEEELFEALVRAHRIVGPRSVVAKKFQTPEWLPDGADYVHNPRKKKCRLKKRDW